MMNARCILLLASLGVLLQAGAQVPAELLERYGAAWKDQPGVVLKFNTTIRVERTNEGVVATKTVEKECLALKSRASQDDQEEVSYSTLVPLTTINAWTMVPKEKNYKKVNVEEFRHRDDRSGSVFHDDSRSVSFHYPGMTVGAITHMDYTVSYPDARLTTGHFFAHAMPSEESTLTVIADKDVEVVGVPFHIPEGQAHYERTVERGRTVQRWTMKNVPSIEFEPNAPGLRYYAPHMQIVVRKPGEKGSTDLERLYAWNRVHIDAALQARDTTVGRIAKEVTAGLTNDRAKAAALYHWVQDHVKYVAVEDGMNGLIPARPGDVCNARYGDCKGMANLLRALLEEAGLKAHLVWVGSREIPYRYDEMPGPMADDHMITAWNDNGELLLMDPTSSSTPFGMPSAFIQGKQAMVAMDADHFRIVDVPIAPPDANQVIDTVQAHLDGTTLVGTCAMYFLGYQRTSFSEAFQRTERKKWNEMVRNTFMLGNNRFQVDTVTLEGLEDRERPLIMRFGFKIPGFVTTAGNESIIPRFLFEPFKDRFYPKERKLPVEEDYRWRSQELVRIDMPAGKLPTYVPPGAGKEGGPFGYAMSTRVDTRADGDRTLVLENTFHFDTLLLTPNDMDTWRAMFDDLAREKRRSVVIQ